MQTYSVTLVWETAEPVTAESLFEVAAVGGAAGGLGTTRIDTTLSAEADTPEAAIAAARQRLAAAGVAVGPVIAAEVMPEAEADRRLAEPAFPELVGATEVADLLGVSRQRLHELRERKDFPAPVAQLAAGPVWRKGDLTAFADGWRRKPGRPRKNAA
jgi:hypothetical protein